MTDSSKANWVAKGIRSVFAFLDRAAFWLLCIMYEIFFSVSSVELFQNETIRNFYSRIQMIIGVFMIFKLTISLLESIMNPDKLTDKNTGIGSIITRVIISLVMLTILVPINIPNPQTEYEKQLNNNGLLFGSLYSLQNRILSNNTLGRLILGTSDTATEVETQEDLKTMKNVFASTILKGFLRINLVEEDERTVPAEGQSEEAVEANWMCPNEVADVIDTYDKLNVSPQTLLDFVTYDCRNDGKKFVFAYKGFFSTVIALIFIVILLNFTVQVAVRAVKIAVLRLIAPIPIIMYIDPKSGKDGAFSSWVKTLTSTYIDLFLRLAIIYFVIFLIQDMIVSGFNIESSSGIVISLLTKIFIWIGLFVFAQEAPKFIKQVLGIKDTGGPGFFSGLGTILGAAGAIGAARTNWRASKEENEALHPGQGFRNFFKNSGSALVGGISGAYTGMKAGATAKEQNAAAAMKALQQRNALRAAHSTLFGRISDNAYGLFTGQSLSAIDQGKLDANKAAASSLKDFKSLAESEAKAKGDYGYYDGNKYNYERLVAAMKAKDSEGFFKYTDPDGVERRLNVGTFGVNEMGQILDTQTARYLQKAFDGTSFEKNAKKLQTPWEQVSYDMGVAGLNELRDDIISYMSKVANELNNKDDFKRLDDDYKKIGAAIGEANAVVSKMSTNMEHIKHRANNQANKK